MEQGTLGELYITRSVTKHIRKHNKAVAVGAGVGKDYSMIKVSHDFMVVSEGVAETPYLAWVKAINNFACSCGVASGVRVSYMLPEDVDEVRLKEYAGEFNALADHYGIQIVGGNTRVSSAYVRASFLVEVVGSVSSDEALALKAKPDYDIVMAGYTGVLGTNLIIDEKCDQLRERFAPSYIEGCRFSKEDYMVAPMVETVRGVAKDTEVIYLHDVSHGGVYGALWQLGVAMNLGLQVNHKCIPVKQETIEICNYFDINPYMLEGTGALVAVARDGETLASELRQSGFVATVIGHMTKDKNRLVVINEDEKRFLAPVKGDEIYKLVAAY